MISSIYNLTRVDSNR